MPQLFMQIRLRQVLILIGFIIALIHVYFPINIQQQLVVLFITLFVLGIPHGALDFYIDQKINHTESKKHKYFFLAKYILNMVAYALVWYFLPTIAIVIFIGLTAYHFGEIDWLGKSYTGIHKIVYSVLGLSWILFLLSKNIDTAIDVFVLLGQSKVQAAAYIDIAKIVLPISKASLVMLHIILFFTNRYFFSDSKQFFFAVMQIGCLTILNMILPLWLCFGFYFGLWHSILSFDKIRQEFGMENNLAGWKSLLSKALPYALTAWTGIVLFIYFSLETWTIQEVLPLLFIGIAVLALPHLQVFTKIKLDPSK
jgi:Brp/Blh family beta-carotene 15,15'-monooxygenase